MAHGGTFRFNSVKTFEKKLSIIINIQKKKEKFL